MRNVRSLLLAAAAIMVMVTAAQAADQLLTGAISSRAGQKLEGVTVSAKMDGSTITTSVYTDETGGYYFPPLPAGKYRVWAQALGFETAKSSVDLNAARHQDFVLEQITDLEKRIRAATTKEVDEAFRKYVDPKKMIVIEAGDFTGKAASAASAPKSEKKPGK